jgi:hypothetical protein
MNDEDIDWTSYDKKRRNNIFSIIIKILAIVLFLYSILKGIILTFFNYLGIEEYSILDGFNFIIIAIVIYALGEIIDLLQRIVDNTERRK